MGRKRFSFEESKGATHQQLLEIEILSQKENHTAKDTQFLSWIEAHTFGVTCLGVCHWCKVHPSSSGQLHQVFIFCCSHSLYFVLVPVVLVLRNNVIIYSKKSSKNVFQSIHGPTSTTLEQWPAVSNVPPTLSSTFLQREPRCSTCPSALPLPRAKKYFKKNTEAKAPLQKHYF